MRRGGGKFKGRAYENEIAHILEEWSHMKWKRAPLSGGFQKTVVTGDVFCVAEYEETGNIRVPFSFEVKKREAWDLVQFFKDSDKFIVKEWWQQSCDDSAISGKQPILIFAKNYYPDLIMLRTSTLKKLHSLIGEKKLPCIYYIMPENDEVIILRLSEFLDWISFEILITCR